MNSEPAFPRPHSTGHVAQEGMTLRDYFAAKAMQAIVSKTEAKKIPATEKSPGYMQAAIGAYDYADAMLEARKVQP